MKGFARQYIRSENLVAFAFVEGLLFSASFASIYWLKTQNVRQHDQLILFKSVYKADLKSKVEGLRPAIDK